MKRARIVSMVVVVVIVVIIFVSLKINSPADTPIPTRTPQPTATIIQQTSMPSQTLWPVSVLIEGVPFTSQAPFGDWKDERQQDGCEETSALIAMRWVRGRTLSKEEALAEILAIANYEDVTYGNFHDTNAQDTVERIFKGYYHFEGAKAVLDITTKDIERALREGMVVLVPANGQKLGNPNYTAPGPDRHMLVIIGYDPARDEFITNDPGTRKGKGYRYKASVLQGALFNYPTGDHVEATEVRTAMITVQKEQ